MRTLEDTEWGHALFHMVNRQLVLKQWPVVTPRSPTNGLSSHPVSSTQEVSFFCLPQISKNILSIIPLSARPENSGQSDDLYPPFY